MSFKTSVLRSVVLTVLAFATVSVSAEEPRTWIGPNIDEINTLEGGALEGGTLLDVVKKIREGIAKDKDSPIALRIEVSDADLSKGQPKMAVRKIPAMVALSYVADIGHFELIFEKGIWVLRNTPLLERVYDGDIITMRYEHVTPVALQALGLIEGEDGVVSTQGGAKWPKEDWGRVTRIGDVTILCAYRHEVDSFISLLKLHRGGYRIPKINSILNVADHRSSSSDPKPRDEEKKR